MITQALLKEHFIYDEVTGFFYRLKNSRKAGIDRPTGSINSHGYILISIQGRGYKAHRLAWLYYYGEWPKEDIDHINHNKTDNRIANLRECSRAENNMNRRSCQNMHGAKGVRWQEAKGKYRAVIKIDGKYKWLGHYETVDEAAHAYNKAAIEHFGEFACLNPIGEDYE